MILSENHNLSLFSILWFPPVRQTEAPPVSTEACIKQSERSKNSVILSQGYISPWEASTGGSLLATFLRVSCYWKMRWEPVNIRLMSVWPRYLEAFSTKTQHVDAMIIIDHLQQIYNQYCMHELNASLNIDFLFSEEGPHTIRQWGRFWPILPLRQS